MRPTKVTSSKHEILLHTYENQCSQSGTSGANDVNASLVTQGDNDMCEYFLAYAMFEMCLDPSVSSLYRVKEQKLLFFEVSGFQVFSPTATWEAKAIVLPVVVIEEIVPSINGYDIVNRFCYSPRSS